MNAKHAVRRITADEFVQLIEDGQKADLLNGLIYMASPDSPTSGRVNVFLAALVLGYVSRQRLGEVYGPRNAYKLAKHYAPEPDISFVRMERLHLWKGAIFQGPPDMALEIVAPDSVERDTRTKKRVYERAGVPEYWIVDLVRGKCRFLRLEGEKYRLAPLEDGAIFRSTVLPGFWLDTRWILGGELPDALDCLHKILGLKVVEGREHPGA